MLLLPPSPFPALTHSNTRSATNCGCGTTMNADESVARGCALMSAILSPRFKVLPYEVIERQINSIRLSWEEDGVPAASSADGDDEDMTSGDDNSVVIFDKGSNFNVVKRVTLKRSGTFTIKGTYVAPDAEQQAVIGSSDMPLDICEFKIEATKSDPPNRVRVNVKQDINGILTLSSAQVMEELPPEPVEPPKVPDSEMKDGDSKDVAAGDNTAAEGGEEKEKDETKGTEEMKVSDIVQ